MPGSLSKRFEPFHATREEVPSYWMADPTRDAVRPREW